MPLSLLELVEGPVELFDLLTNWRFYACLAAAIAVAIYIGQSVPDPIVGWGLGIPLVLSGGAVGWLWNRRAG